MAAAYPEMVAKWWLKTGAQGRERARVRVALQVCVSMGFLYLWGRRQQSLSTEIKVIC